MASDYIIRYISDLSNVASSAKRLESINTKISQSFSSNFSKATKIVGTSIDNISRKKIDFGGGKVLTDVRTLGTVFQDSSGKYKQLTETLALSEGKWKNVGSSIKDVSGQFAKTNVETEKAKKGFLTLGENLKRLAGRALITIPVWLALRTVMQAVNKTIRDGAKALLDQDRALQKAKRNLTGTTAEIEANFQNLKQTTQAFSLATGESIDNITTAFQRFKTTGLDYETSMRGAIASTKTAILLFGETEQVANAVARSFNVLGGRTDDYTSKGEELESTLAFISEAWKDNAFEVDEFAQALERITPTALSANLSLRDTLVLLAGISNAGIRGAREGRLLSTSILQLSKNFGKFEKTLGINLKTTDSTFERLNLIADAVTRLKATDPDKAQQAVLKLFNIRGSNIVNSLVAVNQKVQELVNLNVDLDKFNKEFEEIQKTTFRQVAIFKNLRTEIGKTFLVGITGGDDFSDTLVGINSEMSKLRKEAGRFGEFLKLLFKSPGDIDLFETIFKDSDLDAESKKRVQELFKNLTNYVSVASPRGIIGFKDILFSDEEADSSILSQFATETMSQLQDELKKASEQKSKITIAPSDLFDISEAVLGSELDRLRTGGALNSELLKAEQILRKQLSIEEEGLAVVERKLAIEKALAEEKRLQSRLGSESLKLFDIAQTEGKGTAKKIGSVLSGESDFNQFVRKGGKDLEIFKEKFADIFKQQEAEKFFKGRGAGIDIQEEAIRGARPSFARTAVAQSKAESTFLRSQNITTNVTAPLNITAEIDVSKIDEVQQAFVDEVSKQLPRAGSQLNNALTKAITGKQNKVL